MRTNKTTKTTVALAGVLAATLTATMMVSASSQKFYEDDPIQVERDTQDASSMKPLEVNLFVDLAYNIAKGSDPVKNLRAQNVNTVDQVPDSSWYTNRAGLTPEDVFRGPDTDNGPAAGTWTVSSSKSDGVTPGFTIKDSNGQRWFLKFDPPGYRAMATGTEVTVTKLMWALGYNVPENHIAYLNRDQLAVGDGAKYTAPNGTTRAMKLSDVDELLKRANREENGSYRVVASKSLAGKPIGRIRFNGTRPDDPNDLVAHEDRRELRGYGVFAAWLNHVDAKSINSLDMLVTENGRSYVRHNLIDFGSALGSAGVAPADYWEGEEYLVEPKAVGKQMAGLGFVFPKWHTTPFYEASSIGRLPLHYGDFDPNQWKPRVPNPAFVQARNDDKFWAANKLMGLSTDLIRAAVKAGEFGDPAAEAFLVRALAERRDTIGRTYLTASNPIVEPAIDNGLLRFTNAAVEADFARAPLGYVATWSTFDNATGATECIDETADRTTQIPVPTGLPKANGSFVKVEIGAIGAEQAAWGEPVTAYFRLQNGAWNLVGFERMQ